MSAKFLCHIDYHPHYGMQMTSIKLTPNTHSPLFPVRFGLSSQHSDVNVCQFDIKMSEETPKDCQSGKNRKAPGSLLFHNYENYDPGLSSFKTEKNAKKMKSLQETQKKTRIRFHSRK